MEGDFRVGEWLVQPKVGTITKGTHDISLEPKVMEVLVYLARHTDDVLPKERIIHAVWGDTFVTDEVLTNAISELRRAFEDNAKDPHTIQTLPRRGYRLIATVTPCGANDAEDASLASGQPWKQSMIVVLAAALLLAVVLILWWNWPAPPAGEPIGSIAVLPLENVSGDPEVEYFSDGITEDIITKLANMRGLRVRSRTSVMRYKGSDKRLREIAEELDVATVLEGSVRKDGDRVRISAQLIDAEADEHLWAETYDRNVAEIFEIQSEVAEQIATALNWVLSPEEKVQLKRKPTENLEAYDAYLKGWDRFWEDTYPARKQAIQYFERAIDLDPNFALAYAGLSTSYKVFCLLNDEYCAEHRETVEKVLKMDDTVPEAHNAMGNLLAFFERDWVAAEKEYRRAKELDPDYSSVNFVIYLLWMGRRKEAFVELEQRTQHIDPLSVGQLVQTAQNYYGAGEYDRVLETAKRLEELDPDGPFYYWAVWLSYLGKGMEEETFSAFLSMREEQKDSTEDLEKYRQVFRESDMQGVYRLYLDDVSAGIHNKPLELAAIYALAGENDAAFEWLETHYESTTFWLFATDARFDSLRDDPRFEQLLRKLNLPEDAIQRHLAPTPD